MLCPQAQGLNEHISVGSGLGLRLSFGCEAAWLNRPISAFSRGLVDSLRKLEPGHHTAPGKSLESDAGPPPHPCGC